MHAPALLSFLLAALLLSACAGGVDPAAFERAAADEIARRPGNYTHGNARAFLVARDGQARGLLWGTIHIRYEGDTVMPRAIRDRFAEASDLTVEVPLDRLSVADRSALGQAIQRVELRPDPVALAQLDPSARAALDAVGLPSGSTERLSFVGLARAIMRRAWAGPSRALRPMDFVDANLMGFARSRNIPVHGLDTREFAFGLSSVNPNGADAAGLLRQTLRQQETVQDLLAWVRRSYGRGRVAEALAGMTAWQAGADDLSRKDRQRASLLTDRNRAWVPLLDAILAQPGFHFVAFGAAHLMGEDGMVVLLRQRGWQVLPCPNDNCPAPEAEKQAASDQDAVPTRLTAHTSRDPGRNPPTRTAE